MSAAFLHRTLALFAAASFLATGPASPTERTLFLPGTVSTPDANELSPTVTPEGDRLFFVRWQGVWGGDRESRPAILVAKRQGESWGTPVVAAFSGEHADQDPFVSPDGRWLYFVSDRPAPGRAHASADLWRVALSADAVPEHLPAPVSSPGTEYSPAVTAAGHLYFASDREGGLGQGDVWVVRRNGEAFLPPEPLGPSVNSATGEWNVWVDPDETVLLFEASSRPTNVSVPGDLYLSVRDGDAWAPAVPLGDVNTEGSDLMPRVFGSPPRLVWGSAPIGGQADVFEADWVRIRARALSDSH